MSEADVEMAVESKKERKVILRSSDGVLIEFREALLKHATSLWSMMDDVEDDDDEADEPLDLSDVPSAVLKIIHEYCSVHAGDKPFQKSARYEPIFKQNNKLSPADAAIMEKLDQPLLYQTMIAADTLGVNGLVEAIARHIAHMMEGKSTAQLRKIFNIKNDFTKEEEERVKKECQLRYDDA